MWIWAKGEAKPNTRMCFRKTFTASDAASPVVINIAVDSKYYLWVNGCLAVAEGGLNRGPTPEGGYYDEVDISKFVKKGENTLALLVWYWGNGGRNSKPSGAAGLNVWGAVTSDKSFKCLAHPAYSDGKPPYPAYLYGGHNTAFDARHDMEDWNVPGFDDSAWEQATELGEAPCAPWGELVKRPVPLLKDFGMADYVSLHTEIIGENQVITASLPYGAWVSPYFEITAKAGDFIDMRTDHYEVPGGPGDPGKYLGQRAEYTAKAGRQSFEVFNSFYGEKVVYTFPKNVEIHKLQYRATGYNCELSGSFSCDDEFLNKLYEKCRRTLYVCMRDNFMDCPDRERGQWIGDLSTQAPQIFYALSRESDQLLKKGIHDFINWKNGDVLWGNVPGIHSSELPSQSLNAISDVGMIKEYVLHSGDESVLEYSIDAIEKYLLLWDMGQDGFVVPREGNWRWYDHGENNDDDILENAWYYLALRFALSVRENEELARRKASIEANFNKAFFHENGYRSGDFVDDRANAMAALCGFCDTDDKKEAVKMVLNSVLNATPYMESYVLEALFALGYKQEALNRMMKRYRFLVANENSTIWEDFYYLGTKNHAWSGSPLTHLMKYVAGIRPTTPGYKTFVVEPFMGHLTELSALVPTVGGDIKLSIKDGELTLTKPAAFSCNVVWDGKVTVCDN